MTHVSAALRAGPDAAASLTSLTLESFSAPPRTTDGHSSGSGVDAASARGVDGASARGANGSPKAPSVEGMDTARLDDARVQTLQDT